MIFPDDVIGVFETVIPDRLDVRPTLVTPPDGVDHVMADPLDVRTWPLKPTDVSPVPPAVIPKTPFRLIEPEDVTGLPETVMPDRLEVSPTLVTVPLKLSTAPTVKLG